MRDPTFGCNADEYTHPRAQLFVEGLVTDDPRTITTMHGHASDVICGGGVLEDLVTAAEPTRALARREVAFGVLDGVPAVTAQAA